MIRLSRILALVAALALGLSPLAPVSAQCVDQPTAGEAAAMPDMPCCPDEAPAAPMTCKIGCVQLSAVAAIVISEPAQPPATFEVAFIAEPMNWLVRPDLKPPRISIRI